MYRTIGTTVFIGAAAIGAVEFAANINRGENFESDVLRVLRNGELNPSSAIALAEAISRDPNTMSQISLYMGERDSLTINNLITPYDDQQWVVATRGNSLVIDSEGLHTWAQGQLIELDEATVQNIVEADLLLISYSSVKETRFDQTSAPIFDVAEGAAQKCKILETKGAVVDTLKATGFRSLKSTMIEIVGENDNVLGRYYYTDTPVFDMLNGGINPYGIFFPGRGRQLQFFENEQEARQLLDLVLSNCN